MGFPAIRRVADDYHSDAGFVLPRGRGEASLRVITTLPIETVKGKKRRVRRLAGGILTFGMMPVPASHPGFHSPLRPAGGADSQSRPRVGVCENAQNGSNGERASGGGVPLPEAHACEPCPREGVSFTKGSRGDRT